MSHKILFFRLWFGFILVLAGMACSPDADPGRRPNILFAIADDASYPHMGAYGTGWIRTPAFDRVASEGLLFMNCYTPNAKCAPSRSSILTGRNSWQLEEAANHWPYFPQKFTTYAESLAGNGYYVGYTAKGWGPGVALDAEGNRRQLTGIPFNQAKLEPPAAHINSIDYAENFRIFLDSLPEDTPFCFWYGSTEPHRAYEWQAGLRKGGKELEKIDDIPAFWPDNDTVRTDLLDYAYEIEWFDQHLEKMLGLLEEQGKLDNTVVIVTADNGMPFPRVKGQVYEYSNHMPLAIMWKKGIQNPGREISDFISFIDFAPTFLELAGLNQQQSGMQPITGKSFTDIFQSSQEGMINPERNFVLLGKERHDVGRPDDTGYPVRGIVRDGYLYLMNFKTDRWPAGNPETGYLNTDGSPTKTWILNERRKFGRSQYWEWNFGKHPEEELYDIREDPDCVINLASQSGYTEIRDQLKIELARKLEAQEDPRILGKGEVFDTYLYSNEADRNFYGRYMSGEKIEAGWVNESDFEKEKIE